MMKILVINTGSSSIKYKLFDFPEKQEISQGTVERIGEENGSLHFEASTPEGKRIEHTLEQPFENHQSGLQEIARILLNPAYHMLKSAQEVQAIGHRVVHGGEVFKAPVVISEAVTAQIKALIPLAPLHNPANLTGIEVARKVFPQATQVAVFDTAFHQSLPDYAYRYAVPHRFYKENSVRVYGMHGTSHQYVAGQAATYLDKPLKRLNLITIHLGNGCSMTAIRQGKSIDTSMGFSPLAGLMMGTRSGDIDPAVVLYMGEQLGMSLQEIDHILNKESGLKGLTGSNDLRDVTRRLEEGDPQAQLALTMYTYRIRKYIGAYVAILGRVDALVFTAGVGENSTLIRSRSCQELSHIGIHIDERKNEQPAQGIREVQADDSPVKILIVPTNEELAIAQQTYALVH